jgi:3-deoxy-7-phosphoheptulonate synthase
LAEAAEGRQFVLQAGDCAERFVDCTPVRITNTRKVLLQMSLVLVIGARRPVIRIGRFAGQYAKPRSANLETRDGVSLPSYRGDNINRAEFTADARRPDPQLLLRGYERASMTLNFVRALVKGGLPICIPYFDLDWVKDSPLAEYHRMVQTIKDSLRFVENVPAVRAGDTDKIDFFTYHEALHLGYESAQAGVPRRPGYSTCSHFPRVGLRTNHPDSARGIRGLGTDGIKVGAGCSQRAVARWLEILDPNAARPHVIHRLAPEDAVPAPADRARAPGRRQAGVDLRPDARQRTLASGIKTRNFRDVVRGGAVVRHSPAIGPAPGSVHRLTREYPECLSSRGRAGADLGGHTKVKSIRA